MVKKVWLISIVLLALGGCGSSDDKPNTNSGTGSPTKYLDIMAVLDTDDSNTKSGKNETLLNHLFSTTNTIYANSGFNYKVRLVHTHKTKISARDSDSALDEIFNSSTIASRRESQNADVVVVFQEYLNDKYCGIAFANTRLSKRYAYAHVTLDCPTTTMAHEVGHTLGLGHSPKQDHQGRHSYSQGWGVDNVFHTVMAYSSSYNTRNELYQHSTPKKRYNGHATGSASSADAVRSLEEALPIGVKFSE